MSEVSQTDAHMLSRYRHREFHDSCSTNLQSPHPRECEPILAHPQCRAHQCLRKVWLVQARHMFTVLKFFCCPRSDMRMTATALSFACAAVRGARATATYTCDHMHTSTMKATPPSQVLSCGRYSSPHLSSHEPSGNCAASRMNTHTHTERFARISAILQTF